MANSTFARAAGATLAVGGGLTFLINAGLTPRLDSGAPFEETAASSLFLWRQSLSAVAAASLLFGSIGLALRQADRAGRFGAIAFAVAFVGSALLFAMEWSQVFLVRDLALRFPDAVSALEGEGGPTLYDLGAMISLGVFTIGWLLLAIATWRAGAIARLGPILLIVGFLVTPLFAAILPGLWGLALGNAVLGAGWFRMGTGLRA